jgi:hypothetical protein
LSLSFTFWICSVHFEPGLYILSLSYSIWASPVHYEPVLHIWSLSCIFWASPIHFEPVLYISSLSYSFWACLVHLGGTTSLLFSPHIHFILSAILVSIPLQFHLSASPEGSCCRRP